MDRNLTRIAHRKVGRVFPVVEGQSHKLLLGTCPDIFVPVGYDIEHVVARRTRELYPGTGCVLVQRDGIVAAEQIKVHVGDGIFVRSSRKGEHHLFRMNRCSDLDQTGRNHRREAIVTAALQHKQRTEDEKYA